MLAPIISLFYKEPELKILIPLMGLSLMISAIGRQYQTIEQKNLNFKLIAVINIFSIILSIGIAILLAIFGFGVYSLVYSALTQYFFSNIIFFIAGIRKRKLIFHFDYKETKPYLKIGLYQVGGQIVNYFNRDFDILIIGKYFGIEILGGYNLAKQLVFRPTQILNPIVTNIASPILPKYQNNIKQLKENYLKIVKLVASINFPIYLIIIIFAGYLVNILYGDQYQNITGIVRVLSVYMFLRAIGNPVGALFIATGKTQYDLSWNLFLLMIFPLIILIGCQFSIMMVASLMTISMLLFSYPFWYFIIRPLVGANFIEYVNSLIPSIFMLINAIKNRNQA